MIVFNNISLEIILIQKQVPEEINLLHLMLLDIMENFITGECTRKLKMYMI